MTFRGALAYAERHELAALVVADGDAVRFERYGDGFGPETPHALYSGTKSFWGLAAAAAAEDGLLALDERVSATIGEWRADAVKATMTVRELLNLTSGFGFGGLGAAVPVAAKALATPLKNDPGTVFTYGGIPLQVFGELLRRKLGGGADEPHAFLGRRILERAGVAVASWRTLRDGTHPLPTGAVVSAQAWVRYGRLLLGRGIFNGERIVGERFFAECIRGSSINPRYGLGFWLDPLASEAGVFYASGAGGQALYVLPAHALIVVHFGRSNSWRHETFLRELLRGL
ncbi:MAG: serine hydrolase domain-containing protein [Candidatus Velthaea sp.]